MSLIVKTMRLLGPVARYSRRFSLCSTQKNKLEPDDAPQKTTISLGSNERGNLYQPTGLYAGGFQFGESCVTGSIALLPGTVLKWNVGSLEGINERSLSLFGMIYPPIEMVVIGTGTRFERIDPRLAGIMRQRGISLEIQDTKNACGTYNLLQQERPGLIGAALLPLTELSRPQLPNLAKRKRLPADNI